MDPWEQRLLLWAVFSIASFTHFLANDPSFNDWADVYYFCGSDLRYCTPSFRWNARGWRKAIILWNFCLATALAAQRLAVEAGLGGFLPGEDAVARESFISIAWRLIPFFLNRWESSFGAECSSILFELPHFSLELLVVLPLVQIIAGRLRIVAHPHIQPRRENNNRGGAAEAEGDAMAVDVLRCGWIRDSSQRRILPRLRANVRIMAMIVLITGLAAFNALVVPLAIERQAAFAPRSEQILGVREEIAAIIAAGQRAEQAHALRRNLATESSNGSFSPRSDKAMGASVIGCLERGNCTGPLAQWLAAAVVHRRKMIGDHENVVLENDESGLLIPTHWAVELLEDEAITSADGRRLAALLFHRTTLSKPHMLQFAPQKQALDQYNTTQELSAVVNGLTRTQEMYFKKVAIARKGGQDVTTSWVPKLYRNLNKHAEELHRMRDPEHGAVVPLVELALAIMRLSSERWFALVAVYLGYVVFRDPPIPVRTVIIWISAISRIFQRAILLSFPGVCWAYGAGFVFSTFVSAIFWVGPIMRAVEKLRSVAAEVEPREWHEASPAEIERMGGVCAICWGELALSNVNEPGTETRARTQGGAPKTLGTTVRNENFGDPHTHPSNGGSTSPGSLRVGLPCGHAYHRACLLEWLQSCFGQSRKPTCPMCQAEVPLKVKYRMQFLSAEAAEGPGDIDGGAGGRGAHQEGGRNGDNGALPHRHLHPQGQGIPGIDALVDNLAEEYYHRFELPVGVHQVGGFLEDNDAFDGEPAIRRAPPEVELFAAVPQADVHGVGPNNDVSGRAEPLQEVADVNGMNDMPAGLDRMPEPEHPRRGGPFRRLLRQARRR